MYMRIEIFVNFDLVDAVCKTNSCLSPHRAFPPCFIIRHQRCQGRCIHFTATTSLLLKRLSLLKTVSLPSMPHFCLTQVCQLMTPPYNSNYLQLGYLSRLSHVFVNNLRAFKGTIASYIIRFTPFFWLLWSRSCSYSIIILFGFQLRIYFTRPLSSRSSARSKESSLTRHMRPSLT